MHIDYQIQRKNRREDSYNSSEAGVNHWMTYITLNHLLRGRVEDEDEREIQQLRVREEP